MDRAAIRLTGDRCDTLFNTGIPYREIKTPVEEVKIYETVNFEAKRKHLSNVMALFPETSEVQEEKPTSFFHYIPLFDFNSLLLLCLFSPRCAG